MSCSVAGSETPSPAALFSNYYYYYNCCCYYTERLYLDNDWQTISLQEASIGNQFLKTTVRLSVMVYVFTVASIVDS